MTLADLLRLLEILVWPIVASLAIFIIRPHLATLLGGAKVKFSVAGQSIETTLPVVREILEEQAGAPLSTEEIDCLHNLQKTGKRVYENGVPNTEQPLFRPLRNAGLIRTDPRTAFLNNTKAIEISALGKLYLRAKTVAGKGNTDA